MYYLHLPTAVDLTLSAAFKMDEQPQPEIIRIHLTRRDSGLSWGFRLQGGVDFNTPLSVQVVSVVYFRFASLLFDRYC